MTNQIKVERARHNMTQAELADKANVSRQTINAIEQGKYIPSATLVLKIAKIFNMPVEQVFQLEDGD